MSNKNSEHLMDKWYESIYKKLKESGDLLRISDDFSELHSNHERVSFTWKLDCVQETLSTREMFLEKSATKSILARTEGNKEFQAKKFTEALSLYNESVKYAPMLSAEPEFSMAVANRSAVLIHLKKYNECLEDIELALSYGYPDILRYKIYERQGKCYFFLLMQSKALESFKKAKDLLLLSNLSPEKINTFRRNLDSWIKRSKEGLKQNEKKLITCDSAKHPMPGLTNGGNSVFPCLSSKLDVTYDNEKGRHIKSVEKVEVGDVVAVEKPYASVLLPENYPTHCLHCLKRVLAPLPCRQCARVGFCSEACEASAWGYHRFECKYLDFLVACDIGKFGFLSLRVITKTTWPTLKEFDSEKCPEEPALEDGSPSNSVYRNTYFEIYHLVAHTKDRSTSDLFRRSIMSVLLVKCLDAAGYFGQRASREESSVDVICVGSHLLRMLQVLPCNAHEISEFMQIDKDLVNSHTIEIAAAIYATFSLFNHCCDPCVTRNFYGDTCVMRSIQTIAKGDEVVDNYGYVSAVTPLTEREAELKKQYYFVCSCPACVEGWPLYADLESRVPILKCRRCNQRVPSKAQAQPVYQCWSCQEEMNVPARLSEVYDAGACLKVGIDKMIEGDDKTALPQLIACIERLDHCVSRPWQDINSCQQGIIQCYNVLQSNRHFVRK